MGSHVQYNTQIHTQTKTTKMAKFMLHVEFDDFTDVNHRRSVCFSKIVFFTHHLLKSLFIYYLKNNHDTDLCICLWHHIHHSKMRSIPILPRFLKVPQQPSSTQLVPANSPSIFFQFQDSDKSFCRLVTQRHCFCAARERIRRKR